MHRARLRTARTLIPAMSRAGNIALIGFMTAGKTQVGRALGLLTGMPFRDLDALISEHEKRSIPSIFQDLGEGHFRRVESDILRDLCRENGQIIGCGGGTILSANNREVLARRCETVWLRVGEAQVLSRLEVQNSPRRPLLEGKEPREVVRRLLAEREPFYAQADHFVETDGRRVEDVTREIAVGLGLLKLDGDPSGPVGER